MFVAAAGNLADGFFEAHVEHAVGLVQHQGAHAAQMQGAFARQLLDAPGRTDHHVRVVRFQRGQLWAQRHAPVSTTNFMLGMPVASLRSCLPT